MKKNIIIYLSLFTLLYLILKNNIIISINIISISYVFISKVLPYFLIMYILSKLLINYNFVYYISKLFNNNIYVYILLISFISGSPNNIYVIKELLNKGIISIEDANKYIKCSSFNNPLFLYNMLIGIFNKKICILVIVIQVIANIIIYSFNKTNNKNIIKINTISFNKVLIQSIKDASNILLNIYITICIFNIIISILPSYFNIFIGLIEITKGLDYLRYLNNDIIIKILLTSIYISFGGLSIHMQVKSALEGTNIKYINYLLSRIYHIIIVILITYSCYCCI